MMSFAVCASIEVLHTMFINNANVACNNTVFNGQKIRRMPKKTDPPHKTVERLFIALEQAGLLDPERPPTSAARALNVSPQVITNWSSQKRGISAEGAIEIQQRTGISASWIRNGSPPIFIANTPKSLQLSSNWHTGENRPEYLVREEARQWPFAPVSESEYYALSEAGKIWALAKFDEAVRDAAEKFGRSGERKTS